MSSSLFLVGFLCLGMGLPQCLGDSIPKDPLPLIEEAAEAGDARAEFNLGVRYWFGKGVMRDRGEAIEYFRKAAEKSHARAQFFLGTCYADGDEVPRDMGKALEWFRSAAELGCVDAQTKLADMYVTGKGVEQDYGVARKWLQMAAETGHVVSQCNMGLLYMNGRGVEKDYEVAAEWFKKAALAGDTQSQYYLGRLYLETVGDLQNLRAAAKWLTSAAREGHADAQALLGLMYYRGEGVSLNYPEAYRWTLLAAAQGQEDAVKSRYVMRRQMTSEQVQKAQELVRRFQSGDTGPAPKEQLLPTLAPADMKRRETCVGLVVSADGFVITPAHPVRDAFVVKVKTRTEILPGTVVYTDPTNDLAIVKITGEFRPLVLSRAAGPEPGDQVLTLDYPDVEPEEAESVPITGRISKLARVEGLTSYLLVDLSVPVGNAGCPLIDRRGEVAGILGVLPPSGVLEDLGDVTGGNEGVALDASTVQSALAGVGPVAKGMREAAAIAAEEAPTMDSVKDSVVLVIVTR